MTDGSAGRAARLAAAREWVGAAASGPRRGRDPVNQPMIHHWVQALDDRNPVYVDDGIARGTRHGGLVAPPAMLQTWTMDALSPRDGEDQIPNPQDEVLGRVDEAGFTSVVATNYEHDYLVPVRPGMRITATTSVEDMSDVKTTGLGEGLFVTLRHDYTDEDGAPVGVGRMRLLKFAPPDADAAAKRATAKAFADPANRMRPARNLDNDFFWDAAADERLVIQRCSSCQTLRHPPRPMCGACQSTEWDLVDARGHGTIHSFVVHRYPPLPGVTLPHVVVLVDLDEGMRIVSELRSGAALAGADPETVAIGQEVELRFDRVADDLTLPVFVAAGTAPALAGIDTVLDTDTAPATMAPRVSSGPDDVRVGDVLAPFDLELTPTAIISTAIASRDYQDVHHDPALAKSRGSEDIFMNILATNGYVLRYATDWGGPDAIIEGCAIRLGVPNYAGDAMHLTGEVTDLEDRAQDRVATITVIGANSIGNHVTGTVTISLPAAVGGPA